MVEVIGLYVYPVKSLAGIEMDSARMGIRGLEHDRMWMVTDSDFRFVTQRQFPKMATVSVGIEQDELILDHPDVPPLGVLIDQGGNNCVARVWDDDCTAIDVGSEASQWLTEVLGTWKGQPLHLVKFSRDFQRHVDPDCLQGVESHTGFADGFPFLVTNQASLSFLNKQLCERGQESVPMNRFRPNIVIQGLPALGENEIDTLSGEFFQLGLRKPCSRCKTITVEQETGVIPNQFEPLQTLVKSNPFKQLNGAYFGQNAILLHGEGQTIAKGNFLVSS